MFLLIPLLIIFVSGLAITAIIWRKRPYLKEMIITEGNNSEFNLSSKFSFLEYGEEFFPELSILLKKIKIDRYKSIVLTEVEKFLRKTRLVFLRVDRVSDLLIKKVRKVHLNGQLNGHVAEEKSHEDNSAVTFSLANNKKEAYDTKPISPSFLKNEEQRLIIEIAKNPKDAHLYEMLGDLYTEMENFADAKESYEASIELNSQNESLKQKLSGVLEKLNQS